MNSPQTIRIGTRESALALYQAHEVQRKLQVLGIATEVITITSDGDIDLVTPLYEMGIQGIFTKSLDIALLQNRIDIAVHSTKDVPTKQARGLTLCAMLQRATPHDCLVLPAGKTSAPLEVAGTIGTSSLRRKLQWLHRYPHHRTENLRGNVQTRLKKLDDSQWHGAIFAQAAVNRLDITSHTALTLDWMLPSPAQGAIGIMCRQDDARALEICKSVNHTPTSLCITAERDFLAALHGGCAVPIAAHAQIEKEKLFFRGNIMSLDAARKLEIEMEFDLAEAGKAGELAAQEIRKQGADEIIQTFRS
ncbi:MAG: hydroxymethylbilane synthase [Bacteroidota bacterium]